MAATLDALLPPERVQSGPVPDDSFGNHAFTRVYPESEEEIAAVLRYAHEQGLSVIPSGNGTKRGYGGLDETADILLSLARMTGITEHSAGDLTMAVRPGTTIEAINEALKPHGQMLPLDVPWPEEATIGGVIAANDSGPKRLKYGSARDMVIGLRVVYPDGKVIRTGGNVVKNVAGYDMNKLFIGSMGTLGVISEVRVKLRPLPPFQSLLLIPFDEADHDALSAFVIDLQNSHLEPSALELLSPRLARRLAGGSTWTLAVAFEDREKAVIAQESWVKEKRATDIIAFRQDAAARWWREFSRIAPNAAGRGPDPPTHATEIAIKIGSKNADVIPLLLTGDALAEALGVTMHGHGGVGHGISRLYAQGADAALLQYVEEVRRAAEDKEGYAVVTHMPLSLRRRCDAWGGMPAHFPLLRAIKQTIDPKCVLNPRRFVGGL